MIGWLIAFLVFTLILYIVWWVLGIPLKAFGAPPYVHQIIGAILVLILLMWVLHSIGYIDLDFDYRWRRPVLPVPP